MRGRKPKPAAVLKLEKGKLYGEQADRLKNEPQANRKIIPMCPEYFSEEQKKEWDFLSEILKNYGIFNIANAPHLEMAAIDRARWKECQKMMALTGSAIMINGLPSTSPFFKQAMKLEEQIRESLNVMGISLTALARFGSLLSDLERKKSGMESLLD